MDPEAYKKYNKQETGSSAGIYKHPESDEELWCTSFPQADAAVRQGWKFDRALPSKKEIRQLHVTPEAVKADDELKAQEENQNSSQSSNQTSKSGTSTDKHVANTGTVVGESQGTGSKSAQKGNK